jgi:hypothetical protein
MPEHPRLRPDSRLLSPDLVANASESPDVATAAFASSPPAHPRPAVGKEGPPDQTDDVPWSEIDEPDEHAHQVLLIHGHDPKSWRSRRSTDKNPDSRLPPDPG